MVKRGATRRRKMRGGGEGQVQITWTLHGDKDEVIDLNDMLYEWEEGGWDDTERVTGILSEAVEDHVKRIDGYVSDDRHPNTDPTLGFVDVKFTGKEGPQIPRLDISIPGPDGTYKLSAEFDTGELFGGRRRRKGKTRGRRRH